MICYFNFTAFNERLHQLISSNSAPDASAYAAAAQGAQQGGYPSAEQMYAAQGYGGGGGDPSNWGGQ